MTLSMGAPRPVGLWLQPINASARLDRQTFTMAILVQNRPGDITGITAGAWWLTASGTSRSLVIGALLYAGVGGHGAVTTGWALG